MTTNNYDILLIAPKYGVFGHFYSFPIGLACISGVLKFNGFRVKCLNLNHHEDEDKVIEEILNNNEIKIVATGGLSAHFNTIKALRDKFKKYKDITFILGGGILSSEPMLMFDAIDIDYGVLNEGEETIVELAEYLLNGTNSSIENIHGIIYKQENKVLLSKPRDSIENLDNLPYPDYDSFEIDKYLDMQKPNDDFTISLFDDPRMLPVLTTRSCPFSCTFCYHPLGKKYRISSLDYFFKWLDYLLSKYEINILMLLDELFSVNKERMMEFAKRIKPYNLKWFAAMRVTDIDDETLKVLKDAGLYCITYGLESASDIVLKSMKKKIKVADVENALMLTKKHDIGIQGNFIFGDSAETKQTYTETLDWWKKNKQYQVMLSSISAYPGTPIYLEALMDNKIEDKLQFIKDGCPQINLTKMSNQEYIGMRQDIIDSIYEYKLYPTILESKITGYDAYRGNLYSISLICPHCNKENRYNNMHKVEYFVTKTCCRECNQKFDVPVEKMFCDYKYEDTYFFNSKQAVEVAKQNNSVDNQDSQHTQYCYYEGEVIENVSQNCVNIPYDNLKSFFTENKELPLPTKIQFGLASLIRDRRTIQTEFADTMREIKQNRMLSHG